MLAVPLRSDIGRAGAAILLAAAMLCAGGSARASCGDYLTIDGKPVAHRDHTPAKPCDGPNCSGAPAPVPVPMTAPVPVSGGAKDTAAGILLAGGNSPPTLGFS